MHVWFAIVQEFEMGVNCSVLIEKQESQVAIKFHRNYLGGITGFVCDYEDTSMELEMLNIPYDGQHCMFLLLHNLLIPDDTEWMVAHCENKFTHDFSFIEDPR
jgi:hypothetical protein